MQANKFYSCCYNFLSTREHDKGPDLFFHTLYQLADQGLQFKVSVLGETFSEVPGNCLAENSVMTVHSGTHVCSLKLVTETVY